jgi:hypothetical protein
MSHEFTCKTKVTERSTIQSVCDRFGYPVDFNAQSAKTYSKQHTNPFAVIEFPGWRHPFIITKDHEAVGDVYDDETARDENGIPIGTSHEWGDMEHARNFMQGYSREVCEDHLVGSLNFSPVHEETTEDGWLAVTYEDPLQ